MNRIDPRVVTFGCRLNIHESEIMRGHAQACGLKNSIIFNTCAVTKEAERQAQQAIRKARRENPGARIIVTGCAAQIDPERYARMPEVDQVIGNDVKLSADAWAGHDPKMIRVNDIMEVRETAAHLVSGFETQTRAFVQVQNGCDHRCTFCIIPYGRGPSRSIPMGVITEQLRKLAESGYQEIVMTGVDVTSYGTDLPGAPSLGQMIRRVLAQVPEIRRLRLSSLDPAAMDPDLWNLIAEEPRFMPHLHLSVQSGDDMILKRMRRRHTRADVVALCERARNLRPDILFGADLIAGFPTETEEMFLNTLKLVEESPLTLLHVFPYSSRRGTPASRMPQIPLSLRKDRAARLREQGKAQERKFLKLNINKSHEVLVEKGNKGHTKNFLPVRFLHEILSGQIVTARVVGIENEELLVDAVLS
ncbi:MAG: tRNA (N(6)-L-threonylcarbamoyladenosine(37)-C(2))-methylthiotransferase MtaB [Rhodospirillales bacterium]|nr:tRNA (N(6)-L-threonylcarbamoyladenosine(37)-C(2))-methylthiotransferase MtaB [Rhodospirillales bacterium]